MSLICLVSVVGFGLVLFCVGFLWFVSFAFRGQAHSPAPLM